MKPTFILIHTECINSNKDSVCHVILVPVVDGERKEIKDFILNPESEIFEGVSSGLSREEIEKAPTFASKWTEISDILTTSPMIVSSADGNSIYSLYGTLSRLGLLCPEMSYMNAKAICRRSLDTLLYNFESLCIDFLKTEAPTIENPVGIAEAWADLVLKGLSEGGESTLHDFAKDKRIRIGSISSKELVPSISLSVHSSHGSKNRSTFDPTQVKVEPMEEHPLYGLTVVFTGKMRYMTRDEAREYVISIGGISPNSLTKKTDILVVGQEDVRNGGCTGKLTKALEYRNQGMDIEVMYEEDFMEILRNNPKKY